VAAFVLCGIFCCICHSAHFKSCDRLHKCLCLRAWVAVGGQAWRASAGGGRFTYAYPTPTLPTPHQQADYLVLYPGNCQLPYANQPYSLLGPSPCLQHLVLTQPAACLAFLPSWPSFLLAGCLTSVTTQPLLAHYWPATLPSCCIQPSQPSHCAVDLDLLALYAQPSLPMYAFCSLASSCGEAWQALCCAWFSHLGSALAASARQAWRIA